MKLLQLRNKQYKEVEYFGLKLEVPIGAVAISTDEDGKVSSYGKVPTINQNDNYWIGSWWCEQGVVDLEGMDWKKSLMILPVNESLVYGKNFTDIEAEMPSNVASKTSDEVKPNFKFSMQPSSIDPDYAIWFEDDNGMTDEEKWSKNSIQIVRDFEKYLIDVLKFKYKGLFLDFYNGYIGEVPFFDKLEAHINELGFYTYNSDNYFEIYDPKNVDLDDSEIQECLED